MRRVQLIVLLIVLATQAARGEIAGELAEAARPLNDGVPEMAVIRLQALLKRNLSEADWRAVAEKLLETMVAAHQTQEALDLAADPRLRSAYAVVVHLRDYQVGAPPDYHWAQHVEPIRRGERADIPILPEGWTLEYRGRPQKN